ncbi:MAG: hypothetical protein H0T89_11680 [Deltaproteobacteria bacterium]|nr:hypothetical protein [Deltaproteobacteria bacterium]
MRRLHFSVDEQTAKRIQREAKRLGMTVSKYLATLVSRGVGGAWPAGYLERVVGSCVGSALTDPGERSLDDVDLAVR